jgi:glycosyltransferase involved in cell wall biosynthesis
MKIAFYPVFEDSNKLLDFLCRATWYLYPLRDYITAVDFFSTSKCESGLANLAVSDLIDPLVKDYKNAFSQLVVHQREIDFFASEIFLSINYDYVFVATESERSKLISVKDKFKCKFEIVRVDHENVQYADSFFLRFAEKIPGLHQKFKIQSSKLIDDKLPKIRTKKAYLFGTGPNFEYIEGCDFSDGLVVACNSMAINKDIINKINPKLFVIADPIFHAGPSSYAAEFRSSFLDIIGSRDCPIIVPMRDYHIYVSYFPEAVVSRLIPMEFKSLDDAGPVLNIIESKCVTTTSNILTLFQIPLATTVADEIYISGCDGRPLTHNSYFWSHSKAVQINDKMAEIKLAHPAFFNISYDDYYSAHLDTLEKWIRSGEAIGKKFINLTPSYIPALQCRTNDFVLSNLNPATDVELTIIIPLFQAGKYIKRAVSSIVETVGYSYEILIIDDFSEDNGLALSKEIAESNRNVKVFQNFYRKGVSGARNTGLKLSRGNVVCFLDADDYVFPNSLNARYEHLKKAIDSNIVHSTLQFVDPSDNYLGVEVGVKRRATFKDCNGNPASFNTLMFKRQVLKFLTFDENLTNGEDWLAISKILRMGYVSDYVENGRAAYRIHPESTIIKDSAAHEEKLLPVVDWLYSTIDSSQSADVYVDGIKSGSRKNITIGRRINTLIMNIFSNSSFAEFILKMDADVIGAIKDDLVDFTPKFNVPFVRSYCVHISKAKDIGFVHRKSIANNLLLLKKMIGGSKIADDLIKFMDFGLNDFEFVRSNGTLAEANRLFRMGVYLEAKTIYQELLSRDNFYNFLRFNIQVCDKKSNL